LCIVSYFFFFFFFHLFFLSFFFFFSSRRRHTRCYRDWSSDVCSSDLADGSQTGYALGWGTQKKYGLALVEHTGGQQGTSTSIILAPERRAGIVVLANMDG